MIAALGWWLLHVAGMVVLRLLVYALAGAHYDFGGWLQWVYELSKDLRTFALLVAVQHTLAWYAWRRQSEAHLLAAPDDGPPVEPLERPERFLVRKLGRDFLVATADIEWIQAAGNDVNLHLRGHDYPLRSTMAAIEAKLDPAVFVRIHRSYLVNLDQVQAIEPVDSGDARVHLRDATVLPCSRSHLAGLRAHAGQGTAAPKTDALVVSVAATAPPGVTRVWSRIRPSPPGTGGSQLLRHRCAMVIARRACGRARQPGTCALTGAAACAATVPPRSAAAVRLLN